MAKTIRKNITLDTSNDRDIIEWFDTLPNRSHSLHISKAIKFYLKYKENIKGAHSYDDTLGKLNTIEDAVTRVEMKIDQINFNGGLAKWEGKETEQDDTGQKYINASDLLKNLGK